MKSRTTGGEPVEVVATEGLQIEETSTRTYVRAVGLIGTLRVRSYERTRTEPSSSGAAESGVRTRTTTSWDVCAFTEGCGFDVRPLRVTCRSRRPPLVEDSTSAWVPPTRRPIPVEGWASSYPPFRGLSPDSSVVDRPISMKREHHAQNSRAGNRARGSG